MAAFCLGLPGHGGTLLAQTSPRKLARQFTAAVAAKDSRKIDSLGRELLESGEAKYVRQVIDAVFTVDDLNLETKFLKILREYEGDSRQLVRDEALKTRRAEVRVALIRLLVDYGDGKSLGVVIALLKDKDPRVVLQAVDQLKELRTRYAIEPLIKLLRRKDKTRGVVWATAKNALRGLTGRVFDDVRDWESWWRSHKDSFDPKKVKGLTVDGRTRVRGPKFFGLEVASKRLLFIIDTSYSMLYPMDANETRALVKAGVRSPSVPKHKERLANVKKEVIGVLRRLPPDTRFNPLESLSFLLGMTW